MAEAGEAEFQRRIILAFFTLLLAAGIVIYWAWGLAYDTWYPFSQGNIGIYTIYVPLIAFGIIGILLFRKKKPASA